MLCEYTTSPTLKRSNRYSQLNKNSNERLWAGSRRGSRRGSSSWARRSRRSRRSSSSISSSRSSRSSRSSGSGRTSRTDGSGMSISDLWAREEEATLLGPSRSLWFRQGVGKVAQREATTALVTSIFLVLVRVPGIQVSIVWLCGCHSNTNGRQYQNNLCKTPKK